MKVHVVLYTVECILSFTRLSLADCACLISACGFHGPLFVLSSLHMHTHTHTHTHTCTHTHMHTYRDMFTWSCDPVASPSIMMTHPFRLLKHRYSNNVLDPKGARLEARLACRLHETITKSHTYYSRPKRSSL